MKIRCRAIIIIDNKLIVIKRVKPERIYYVFPGGGLEPNETPEECVMREVFEEIGINIGVKVMIDKIKFNNDIEYFYLCSYLSGIIGSGKGNEFKCDPRIKGHYKVLCLPINKLGEYNIQPEKMKINLNKNWEKWKRLYYQ